MSVAFCCTAMGPLKGWACMPVVFLVADLDGNSVDGASEDKQFADAHMTHALLCCAQD